MQINTLIFLPFKRLFNKQSNHIRF